MHTLARGLAVVCALVVVGVGAPALAAPDRLNDDVPSAFPDTPEAWAFSYCREAIDLEGALTSSSTAHDYFKLRYTFSPKVAASVRYTIDDLNGGLGLVNPVFNDQDSGSSFEVDLRTNLLNQPAAPADEAKQQAFTAGSAFSLGVSGTFFQLDAGNLGRNENLIKAYLLYSTDLTEEMAAHTYFSSGRLAGDNSSGSVNRIGAGIDYVLIPGERPLTLLANGMLDIYNFREPSFNTSRVSRFDVGLRYRLGQNWFTSLGWVTVNDSENDASGSGIFAGLNYVQEPKPPVEIPPVPTPAESAPAEGAPTASIPGTQTMTAKLPSATAPAGNTLPATVKQAASAADPAVTPQLMAGAGYTGSVNRQGESTPPRDFETSTEPAAELYNATGSGGKVTASTAALNNATAIEPASTAEPGITAALEPSLIETAGLRGTITDSSSLEPLAITGGPYYFDPERAALNEQAEAQLNAELCLGDPSDTSFKEVSTKLESTGIAIPPFPSTPPQHTALHAVMIRAGLSLPLEVPRSTAPGTQMTRAPRQVAASPASVSDAADEVDAVLEKALAEESYASSSTGQPKA